ncbi:cytochrome p450 domain-containing protein [Penicillium sp. CMV-2018d]|nr:cytochrome p450 domain-containing protein [Penicillium sp. CMV-2018d]
MLDSLLLSFSYFSHLHLPLSIVVTLLIYSILIHPLYNRLRHVPGPWVGKITSLHLALYDWQLCRNDKISQWHQQYGPVIRVAPNEVSVSTLDAVRQVYGTTSRWEKSNYFDYFQGYNERSMFATKPHHEHVKKRRMTSSFYQATSIYRRPEVEGRIRNRVQAVLDHVERSQGRDTDIYSLTGWYALDNITCLVLGPSHCTQSIEQPGTEREILQELKDLQIWGPIRLRFPAMFDSLSHLLADDHLSDWCYNRFSAAMKDPTLHDSHSLIRQLVEIQKDSQGSNLNTSVIAAEVLDNINAAEATVAVTATYLIWRLTQSPHWQRRVHEELLALPVQSDGLVSFSDVNDHAPVLEACLREVYRLHPASSGRAERIVPKGGCTLSGVYLPPDTIVTSSIVAIHRAPVLFPSPEEFRPERWLEGYENELKQREAHLIPFGYGGRICLGKPLATMEIKVLIAGLYLRYESLLGVETTPESMKQCSTHDAVPQALKCLIRFRKA